MNRLGLQMAHREIHEGQVPQWVEDGFWEIFLAEEQLDYQKIIDFLDKHGRRWEYQWVAAMVRAATVWKPESAGEWVDRIVAPFITVSELTPIFGHILSTAERVVNSPSIACGLVLGVFQSLGWLTQQAEEETGEPSPAVNLCLRSIYQLIWATKDLLRGETLPEPWVKDLAKAVKEWTEKPQGRGVLLNILALLDANLDGTGLKDRERFTPTTFGQTIINQLTGKLFARLGWHARLKAVHSPTTGLDLGRPANQNDHLLPRCLLVPQYDV